MSFYEKVISLCKERGVSRSKMADDIGISRSAPKAWAQSSAPHFSTVKKVADYFGVSVSYFSAEAFPEESPSSLPAPSSVPPIGDIERELLSICERLDMKKKGKLLLSAYTLLEEL